MLPSPVSNHTIASRVVYKAAVTCARASINNSGSSFTAGWMIGTALFPSFPPWCGNIFDSSSNILLQSGLRPSHPRKQLTYSSSSVLSSSKLLLLLPGVAGRSGFRVLFCLGSVGLSGVVPASFPVAAGGIVRRLSLWSLAGPYRRLSRCECWFQPQIHPRPGPSRALQCYSHPFPFLFHWLVVLAVGASCSYRGLEVERVSHGRQAVLMVRWYVVDWRDRGHPCQGNTSREFLTPDTISDP